MSYDVERIAGVVHDQTKWCGICCTELGMHARAQIGFASFEFVIAHNARGKLCNYAWTLFEQAVLQSTI